jgi:hypothetical protein
MQTPEWRDISNAVALGMVIGGMLVNSVERAPQCDCASYLADKTCDHVKALTHIMIQPECWQDIGRDQQVADVERAAEALDRFQEIAMKQDGEFWEEHDWYLTIDKIADKIWENPVRTWTNADIESCLVKM